jgi:ATP-dependent DNA helicase RecG
MTLDELKKIIATSENENVELKEWKNSISFDGGDKFENRKCILGYCIAIGNEGGGYLIIGVDNNKYIVGTNAVLAPDFKQKVYQKTGQKVEVFEVYQNDDKVLVIKIPPRVIGQLLKFAGVPLMRIGDSLEIMSDTQQYHILSEGQDDWSSKVCVNASFVNLNPDAIKKLKELYVEKNTGTKIVANSDEQFLKDVGLINTDSKITNACVLLVAKKEFIDEYFGQAEICFEYRNRVSDIQFVDRVDYRDSFVLILDDIWNKVYSRQQIHQIQQGLFRTDIPAYNQETFREALFNAVCHRDYMQQGSIFIKQSPEILEITNPGGLPFGVTIENIIDVPATPRNKLLAESFQKIFRGVERSGQGADKIFRNTIEEGKGSPDYTQTMTQFVIVKIPAIVQDGNFISFLEKITKEKNILISMSDILILEKIRLGDKKNINIQTVGHLLEKGIIELHGKTRGAQYVLSSEYYNSIGKLGVRTRKIGLSRDYHKAMILEHLKKNKIGTMKEFMQVCHELKRSDIRNLLTELKKDNKIRIKSGRTASSIWELVD